MSKSELKLITYNDFINKRTNTFLYVRDIKHSLKHYNLENKGKKPILIERLNTFFKNFWIICYLCCIIPLDYSLM